MTHRMMITGMVVLALVSTLPSRMAMAQWGGRIERPYGAAPGGWGPPGSGYPGGSYAPYAPPYAPGGYSAGYGPPGAPGATYPPGGPPGPAYPPPAYQPPYAYPQQGQSPQQTTSDHSDCGTWASQQTGFTPGAQSTTAPGAPAASGTSGSSGQVTGLFGGIQRREERREFRQQQWRGQDAQGSQQDGYNRAVNACLSARGYTVR